MWDSDETGLSVFAMSTRGTSERRSIWHYDLVLKEWHEVGTVQGSLVEYVPSQQLVLACGRDSLFVQAVATGIVLSEILSDTRIDCSEVWVVNGERGFQDIAFLTYDPRTMWTGTVETAEVHELISLEKLGIDVQLGISGVSWHSAQK